MEDEDWDEDFGYFDATLKFGNLSSTGRGSRIVGITADRFVPNAESEWDNDFDIIQDQQRVFFSKTQSILPSTIFHKVCDISPLLSFSFKTLSHLNKYRQNPLK